MTEVSLEDAAVRYEIGRLPSSEVLLEHDRGVSRRHAEIVCVGGRWQLTDLRSRNGTYVNGELVRATAALVNGTMIVGRRFVSACAGALALLTVGTGMAGLAGFARS